jgi:hypothetical protein
MLVHFKLKALILQYNRQNLTHTWITEALPIYINGFRCFEEMETPSFRLERGCSCDFMFFCLTTFNIFCNALLATLFLYLNYCNPDSG